MDRLEVGYVARAHGVHGELRVQLHDLASETLFHVERIYLDGAWREVVAARPTQGAVLLTLAGLESREAADALRGKTVEVARADVPLAEGEFFVADLVGCAVSDEAGASLGNVVQILAGPQDILVIHDDAVERLLPLVPEFVISVDVAAKRVVVALPEELPTEPLRGKR